ncbi:MAG: ferredoxin, partial [Oscillospiraceae bacterium]|nr:ferredoxin [Oscillospiraceae bacterium]
LQELLESLPGLDCGSCGAPTCETFAEDVVKGNAEKDDCVIIFREKMEDVYKMLKASIEASGDGRDKR